MKYVSYVTSNATYGKTQEYKVTETGTAYHVDTEDKVVTILENAIQNHFRVRLVYGDRETGKVWNETYDIMGYIGRSCGSIRIPLLVHNSRSTGGGALLDTCILGIMDTEEKRWLYKADNINFGEHSIRQGEGCFHLFINGDRYVTTETEEQAQRFSDFLLCKRNAK